MKRVVAVLGGNVFARGDKPLTMGAQFRIARAAVAKLRPLLDDDVELVLGHGNGPQVGHILLRAQESLGKAYAIPLDVCVAQSQGEIGYVLELALRDSWKHPERSPREVATLLSQVVVDEHDPAFQKPTKPIGPYCDAVEYERLRRSGVALAEDSGRGYRRVVPSPRPRQILGVETISRLLESGALVITTGGGGIPVVRRGDKLEGIEAVIDKDLTAALLADQLDAGQLVILTDVPCVYRDFGTERQSAIGRISANEARQLLDEGQFATGSMGPKIEAAIQFVERPGRRGVICDLPSLAEALELRAGTILESG